MQTWSHTHRFLFCLLSIDHKHLQMPLEDTATFSLTCTRPCHSTSPHRTYHRPRTGPDPVSQWQHPQSWGEGLGGLQGHCQSSSGSSTPHGGRVQPRPKLYTHMYITLMVQSYGKLLYSLLLHIKWCTIPIYMMLVISVLTLNVAVSVNVLKVNTLAMTSILRWASLNLSH